MKLLNHCWQKEAKVCNVKEFINSKFFCASAYGFIMLTSHLCTLACMNVCQLWSVSVQQLYVSLFIYSYLSVPQARPSFEEILLILNKDTPPSDATSQPSASSSSRVTTAGMNECVCLMQQYTHQCVDNNAIISLFIVMFNPE